MGKSSSERFQITLAQTPQRSFQGAAAGTHATQSPNLAHSGSHAETQVFRLGVVSLPSACAAWSGTSARAAVRRAYFAIFAWTEGTSERSREPSERRRAPCASPFRRRRGPAGSRCSTAVSCAAPVSFAVRYHCDEGQRGKFVNVTVVILFVV